MGVEDEEERRRSRKGRGCASCGSNDDVRINCHIIGVEIILEQSICYLIICSMLEQSKEFLE